MLRQDDITNTRNYTPEAVLNLDPLVSDTACHTRAVLLIELAVKLLQNTPLSENETRFIDACSLLTSTRTVERNAFGVIVNEKTNVDALGTELSKTKRNKLISSQKSVVAGSALQFLRESCSGMTFCEKLAPYRSQSSVIKLNSQSIPVLPLYCSAKMMLYAAAINQMPIALTLKRFVASNPDEASPRLMTTMDYSEVVVYMSNNANTFKPVTSKTLNENQPALAIDMVCFRYLDDNGESNDFNASETAQFAASFKQLDLAKLVMMSAVVHDQYPPSTMAMNGDPILADTQQDLDADVPFDLSVCSMRDFNTLSRQASQLGLFANRQLYIDHVYASTISDRKEALRQVTGGQSEY